MVVIFLLAFTYFLYAFRCITEKTRIVVKPKNLSYSSLTRYYLFDCIAKTDPRLNVTVKWDMGYFKNDSKQFYQFDNSR